MTRIFHGLIFTSVRNIAKPIDVVLMFKVLVLQQLNNLSDDRIKYQIRNTLHKWSPAAT